jgi:hypothetical protein
MQEPSFMAISKSKFIDDFTKRRLEARDFWRNWRTRAREEFAFVSGDQWLPEDEAILNEQKRPPITFNYSEKMIDAVVGAEVSNRQEATYRPRTMDDAALAEIWNNAAKWVRDETNAEDEESDAFRDMLICGLGWTQTRMSYDEDLDGKIVIERCDPLELYSDPAASKPGLTDRRYQFREWWVDEKEAKREWPGQALFPTEDANTNRGVITRGNRYNDDTENEHDRHKSQVQVTHYECMELEPIYRVALKTGIQEMSAADFNEVQDQLAEAGIQYAKQLKRTYYRGFFAGETLLEMGLSPCQNGFTFQAITGKRDRNKNTWYGLTRVMTDPQRWANKWLSQILHIINSNAKGGLLAEVNAFVDPTKAQDEWAQPDSITLLREGAIEKVKQKQVAPYPSGLDKLMEFALGSLPMVTGINLEALGLANREQAGVLEQQRKQAAYGLLSPMFDALRRYRKESGRILLYFIHEYISDGRLVRIGGPESQQFLPLTKQPDAPRYDIIVDQSPNAPDTKQQTWEALMQLVPSLLKAGMPLPPDLLDYSPLPVALATKWKQFAAQQQQPDPAMQQQLQQMQQEMQKLQEENQGLKQDQQTEMMALKQKSQQTEAELVLKSKVAQQELDLKRAVAEEEFKLKVLEQEQEFALEQRRLNFESGLKQQQVEGDLKVKAFSAGVSAKKDEKTGKSNLALSLDMAPLADAMKSMCDAMKQSGEDSKAVIAELTDAVQQSSRERQTAVKALLAKPARSN